MKKINFFILFFTIVFQVNSQQFFGETGKIYSSFDYKNSNGENNYKLEKTTHSFYEIGFRKRILLENLKGSVAFNLSDYGAIGYDVLHNKNMEWNMNYLGFQIGLDYSIFKIKKLTFNLKGASSINFLLQGSQTTGSQVYNLINADDFNKPFIFFSGGFGISYPLTNKTSFSLQYLRGKSIGAAPTADVLNRENLKIKYQRIGFGIQFHLN